MGRRGSAVASALALGTKLVACAAGLVACAAGLVACAAGLVACAAGLVACAAGLVACAAVLVACATGGSGGETFDAGKTADEAAVSDDATGATMDASTIDSTTGDDSADATDALSVDEPGDDAAGPVADAFWGDVTPIDKVPDGGGRSDGGTGASDASSLDGSADGSADAGAGMRDGGASTGDGGASVGDGGAGAHDGGVDAGAGEAGVGDAGVGDAGVDAGPCGVCAPGFSCGAAQYCKTPSGVPAFGRVFVIMLDDQTLAAVQGSASAPYINQLMSSYAYGTDYQPADHPSLPNAIALTSGNPQSVACDCQPGGTSSCNAVNCSIIASQCNCPLGVSHLGDELDVAGIGWRQYAESMGSPCNAAGVDGGASLFTASHVPFLYYDDVFNNAGRCTLRVRDYSDFAGDLSGGQYRFSLIAPNLCDDMHSNCSGDPVRQGDTWLSTQVPLLLATPGFAPGGQDVLFIVGDEPFDAALGPASVPFVVVSPLVKKTVTGGAYDHYSLLATIEDGLGVPRLGNAEAAATIADIWR
jgi:hypothetical protein